MPRQLLLATRNLGKLREFTQLLAGIEAVHVLTLHDVGAMPEVIEDGDSFEANARKKATEIAYAAGMLVLSDDSGLEVDALDGRPGVHSARYARHGATDVENNQKLVAELTHLAVPEHGRTARYRVVLALADPTGPLGAEVHFEQGVCEGRIRLLPTGDRGFGYDPYFEPAGYTCSMAELSLEEKNRISHRFQATRKMCLFLADYLAETS